MASLRDSAQVVGAVSPGLELQRLVEPVAMSKSRELLAVGSSEVPIRLGEA